MQTPTFDDVRRWRERTNRCEAKSTKTENDCLNRPPVLEAPTGLILRSYPMANDLQLSSYVKPSEADRIDSFLVGLGFGVFGTVMVILIVARIYG